MLFDRIKYYNQFEQLLDPKNRQWFINEFILLTIETGRFLFYVILSFMDESVLRSYCPYDTTAATLFDYFNHLNDGTSLNLNDCRVTSIILLMFLIFIQYSHYMLYLTDHNSIAWRLLYDVSNRNYDQYRDSIINEQNNSFTKTVIKALSYDNNKFDEFISNSSPKIMHNSLARIMKKNPKSFIDKLIIQLMLNIDLYKFEKFRLKVFSYSGLERRIEFALSMLILHFMDIFLLILGTSTTLNFGCLKYFNFIHIHMWHLWPFAIIDCINHFYCGYILLRNGIIYFNFASMSLIFFSLQMNSLNKNIIDLFVKRKHLTNNSGLNYLRNLFWRRFQRQHQHMTYCIMYSGQDVWNNVYLIAVMANIPLNIVCIYNLVFKLNSWNNEFISLGFLSAQMYILSAIMAMTSTIHFSANQFKRQLPAIQLYMKDPSIKLQVHEFYERLTTTGIGFGYYCGRIALINYHNSFQVFC